jgi:hypothetical protein
VKRGRRSREVERYQHLTPEVRALPVTLIATELFRGRRARRNENAAHLPAQCAVGVSLKNSRGANMLELREMLAGSTGLEPAASGVTGRRSNQLNYDPVELTLNGKLLIANGKFAIINLQFAIDWAVQGSNL